MRSPIAGIAFLLWSACHKVAPAVPESLPAPAPVEAPAPRPVGHWKGALVLPSGALTIVVHIAATEAGALTATLDSPDQGGFGIPVASVATEGDGLVLDVAVIQGRFAGTFAGDDTVAGTWTQGGASLPLSLSRSTDAGPNRPQEPKPPFPYRAEDVEIASVPGVTLAGTLVLPPGPGPFPAVVLVSGSGPQDRDESLMGHRPFAVLADHLARKGIASLRADDRGAGRSTGTFATATTADFAEDARALLAFLDDRPETGATGCLGHSEGALVCPLLQRDLAEDARADFLVLLAGPAVGGEDLVLEQGALLAAAEGAPADVIADQTARNRALFAYVRANPRSPDLRAGVAERLRQSPDAGALTDADIAPAVDQLTSPWFLWFLTYDPAPALREVGVPTLALFGERDLQVPPRQNRDPMAEALGAHGTVEVLPGLNHLFQPAATGSVSEYAKIEVTLDPTALDKVSAFVLAHR